MTFGDSGGGGGKLLFVEAASDPMDVGRSRKRSGGWRNDVGEEFADPNEERFGAGPGPVDRFIGRPEAYIPPDGTGRKVGVDGRDVGVGIELVVETVLVLARPSVSPD